MSHDPNTASGDDHHDPLHDIDGPKTTYAVLGTLLLVVLMIWGASHMFTVMVQVERQAKIGDIEPVEFNKVAAEARSELDGKHPNRGTKTIQQAMQEYIAK